LSSTPRAWRRESREFSFCCFFTTHEPVNASTIGQRRRDLGRGRWWQMLIGRQKPISARFLETDREGPC
jgi:hypothetical protein